MMLKKKTALSLNEWKVEWLKEEIRTQKLMNAEDKLEKVAKETLRQLMLPAIGSLGIMQ